MVHSLQESKPAEAQIKGDCSWKTALNAHAHFHVVEHPAPMLKWVANDLWIPQLFSWVLCFWLWTTSFAYTNLPNKYFPLFLCCGVGRVEKNCCRHPFTKHFLSLVTCYNSFLSPNLGSLPQLGSLMLQPRKEWQQTFFLSTAALMAFWKDHRLSNETHMDFSSWFCQHLNKTLNKSF